VSAEAAPASDARMGPERFRAVSVEDIISPRDGHVVYAGRWWAFQAGSVFFFKGSPQCSIHRAVTAKMGPRGSYPIYITTAFVKEQT
jgi:hypothetical protein